MCHLLVEILPKPIKLIRITELFRLDDFIKRISEYLIERGVGQIIKRTVWAPRDCAFMFTFTGFSVAVIQLIDARFRRLIVLPCITFTVFSLFSAVCFSTFFTASLILRFSRTIGLLLVFTILALFRTSLISVPVSHQRRYD